MVAVTLALSAAAARINTAHYTLGLRESTTRVLNCGGRPQPPGTRPSEHPTPLPLSRSVAATKYWMIVNFYYNNHMYGVFRYMPGMRCRDVISQETAALHPLPPLPEMPGCKLCLAYHAKGV